MRVGDRVICIREVTGQYTTLGDDYEVVDWNCAESILQIINDFGSQWWVKARNFKKKESTMKCHCDSNWKSYEFDIRSPHQINRGMARKELSADNPMMIIERSDSDLVEILVWEGIFKKAGRCECPLHKVIERLPWGTEFYEMPLYLYQLEGFTGYGPIPRRYINDCRDVVRKVKSAEWKDRCKATVTVKKVSV